MKKLLAALSIAALPVIGFAGVAHADDGTTPVNAHPFGKCEQPGTDAVPLWVDCDSPLATTPYVRVVVTEDHQDPTHVAVLANGACMQDQVAVPKQVPCHQASQDQTEPVPAPAARKVARAKKAAPQPVEAVPVEVDWWGIGS